MDKEFIVYAETKASFEAAVSSGDVDTSQIGIIGETGELWENGEYHPLVESISLARDLTGREEATAEEFIFRASGGNKSIRDESAVIRRIKGNTLVWNQRLANPNFADGTLRWFGNNGSLAVNANGSVRFTHTYSGSQSVMQTFTERIPSGHKVLVVMDYQRGDNTAISSLVYLQRSSNGFDRFSFPRIGSNARRVEACIITTTDEISTIMAYPFLNAPVGAYSDIYSINVFDLTQMFGAGNEPSGVSEFKTLFPESCYPYSAPEVRAMRASGIETIGANAFNKEDVVGGVINADDGTVTSNDIYSVANIEVLGNARYTLANVANSALTRASYAIYDNDYRLILTGGFADSVRLQLAMSGSVSLPENARYMRVVVHNDYLDSCCVNITHSGALSDATYFKDVRMLPDIIKYFPDGMHSVGDVYDEINAENAIKRCGVRAYEDGDSANGDVITDGATTVYALEEPIMIPIVDALQLDYNVADYGTEKMLSTQPSTPFRADIVYKFNAVDRIRDNARNIERLEEMMGSSGGSGIDAEVEQSIRILLIGSSLGMNTIGQFPMIAQYSGVKCIVGNVYQGSLTLQQVAEYCESGTTINGVYNKWHFDDNKWVSKSSNMKSVLTEEEWDYVILQNSNAEAEEWKDAQEVALKTIVDYITSLGGKPTIVFNTNCANSLGRGNAANREAQIATTERINKVCELVRNRWGFDILPLASVIQHCRGNDTLAALGKWENGDLAQDSVHLDYGVGMYAAGCMCYNFFLKRFGKSVLTNDYLPTIDQLQNFAGSGVTDLADRFTPITEEIGALIRKEVSAAMTSTSGEKQEVNEAYEAAGAVYNSETETWEMNGITDLTDRDMANIVLFGNFCGLTAISGHFANAKCRTNIRHADSYSPLTISANSFRASKFEVIDVRSTYDAYMTKLTSAINVFFDCQKLKSVLGKLDVSTITAFTNTFVQCKALTDIQLHGLKCNVDFPASPLSVASGIYMMENASTANITIKVMASVYTAWMDDSTIAQLLTSKANITLASL